MLFCDDKMLVPVVNVTATSAAATANTTHPYNSTAAAAAADAVVYVGQAAERDFGAEFWRGQHAYNPLDVDHMVYRLDNVIMCRGWNWPFIVVQAVAGFTMCTGAMMVVVGAATYLAVNRPDTRSSVAASQRSVQMLFVAGAMSASGALFETIGPGWTHTGLAAGASIFGAILCCLDKDPVPRRAAANP